MTEHLLSWYYQRLQATSRSQGRMLWSGIILSLGAILIFFDPVGAKETEFLGFPLKSIEKILPAVIFLLLAVLQGSFIAIKYPFNKIKRIMSEQRDKNQSKESKDTSSINGLYDIDKNLNFIDYLAFVLDRRGRGRMGHLLYPLYILLVAFSALPLLGDQIARLATYPLSRELLFLFVNLSLGIFCYLVSRQFFKGRWKKFISN